MPGLSLAALLGEARGAVGDRNPVGSKTLSSSLQENLP